MKKITVEVRQYRWMGSFVNEDKNRAYYNSVKISDKLNSNNSDIFSVGEIVYFQSDTGLPYIAEIESLYENKSTGMKHVNAKWYYRTQDVKALASQALDNLNYKRYSELFLSDMKDENDVQSILKHVHVLFFESDQDELINSIFSSSNAIKLKDTFFCRHRFDTNTLKVVKIKGPEITILQEKYKQTQNLGNLPDFEHSVKANSQKETFEKSKQYEDKSTILLAKTSSSSSAPSSIRPNSTSINNKNIPAATTLRQILKMSAAEVGLTSSSSQSATNEVTSNAKLSSSSDVPFFDKISSAKASTSTHRSSNTVVSASTSSTSRSNASKSQRHKELKGLETSINYGDNKLKSEMNKINPNTSKNDILLVTSSTNDSTNLPADEEKSNQITNVETETVPFLSSSMASEKSADTCSTTISISSSSEANGVKRRRIYSQPGSVSVSAIEQEKRNIRTKSNNYSSSLSFLDPNSKTAQIPKSSSTVDGDAMNTESHNEQQPSPCNTDSVTTTTVSVMNSIVASPSAPMKKRAKYHGINVTVTAPMTAHVTLDAVSDGAVTSSTNNSIVGRGDTRSQSASRSTSPMKPLSGSHCHDSTTVGEFTALAEPPSSSTHDSVVPTQSQVPVGSSNDSSAEVNNAPPPPLPRTSCENSSKGSAESTPVASVITNGRNARKPQRYETATVTAPTAGNSSAAAAAVSLSVSVSAPYGDPDDYFPQSPRESDSSLYFLRNHSNQSSKNKSSSVRVGTAFQAVIPHFICSSQKLQQQQKQKQSSAAANEVNTDAVDVANASELSNLLATTASAANDVDESITSGLVWSPAQSQSALKSSRKLSLYLALAEECIQKLKESFLKRDSSGSLTPSPSGRIFINGNYLLVSSKTETMVYDILHSCNYVIDDALELLHAVGEYEFLTEWTKDEQVLFQASFVKYGDDLRKISGSLSNGGKSIEDVIEYYFRCIYGAAQLENVNINEVNFLLSEFSTSSESSSALEDDGEGEADDDIESLGDEDKEDDDKDEPDDEGSGDDDHDDDDDNHSPELLSFNQSAESTDKGDDRADDGNGAKGGSGSEGGGGATAVSGDGGPTANAHAVPSVTDSGSWALSGGLSSPSVAPTMLSAETAATVRRGTHTDASQQQCLSTDPHQPFMHLFSSSNVTDKQTEPQVGRSGRTVHSSSEAAELAKRNEICTVLNTFSEIGHPSSNIDSSSVLIANQLDVSAAPSAADPFSSSAVTADGRACATEGKTLAVQFPRINQEVEERGRGDPNLSSSSSSSSSVDKDPSTGSRLFIGSADNKVEESLLVHSEQLQRTAAVSGLCHSTPEPTVAQSQPAPAGESQDGSGMKIITASSTAAAAATTTNAIAAAVSSNTGNKFFYNHYSTPRVENMLTNPLKGNLSNLKAANTKVNGSINRAARQCHPHNNQLNLHSSNFFNGATSVDTLGDDQSAELDVCSGAAATQLRKRRLSDKVFTKAPTLPSSSFDQNNQLPYKSRLTNAPAAVAPLASGGGKQAIPYQTEAQMRKAMNANAPRFLDSAGSSYGSSLEFLASVIGNNNRALFSGPGSSTSADAKPPSVPSLHSSSLLNMSSNSASSRRDQLIQGLNSATSNQNHASATLMSGHGQHSAADCTSSQTASSSQMKNIGGSTNASNSGVRSIVPHAALASSSESLKLTKSPSKTDLQTTAAAAAKERFNLESVKFVILLRSYLDDLNFSQVFNALLVFEHYSLSAAEFVVRVQSIIEKCIILKDVPKYVSVTSANAVDKKQKKKIKKREELVGADVHQQAESTAVCKKDVRARSSKSINQKQLSIRESKHLTNDVNIISAGAGAGAGASALTSKAEEPAAAAPSSVSSVLPNSIKNRRLKTKEIYDSLTLLMPAPVRPLLNRLFTCHK